MISISFQTMRTINTRFKMTTMKKRHNNNRLMMTMMKKMLISTITKESMLMMTQVKSTNAQRLVHTLNQRIYVEESMLLLIRGSHSKLNSTANKC